MQVSLAIVKASPTRRKYCGTNRVFRSQMNSDDIRSTKVTYMGLTTNSTARSIPVALAFQTSSELICDLITLSAPWAFMPLMEVCKMSIILKHPQLVLSLIISLALTRTCSHEQCCVCSDFIFRQVRQLWPYNHVIKHPQADFNLKLPI